MSRRMETSRFRLRGYDRKLKKSASWADIRQTDNETSKKA
jgi:hypothetical protein